MRARSRAQLVLALLAAGLLSACASGSSSDDIVREPGFRTSSIRRPALLVRVGIDETMSERERARIPEDYQAAIVEGLDRLGILLVDVAMAPPGRSRVLQGIDRPPALARAREAGAEHLVIVDARLSRGDLIPCQRGGRPLIVPTVYWDAALEIDRVSNGKRLYAEPPAEDTRVVDVEFDCRTGKLIRRRSMDELINDSVGLLLAPFNSR